MSFLIYLNGLMLGFSLIMALGPQNIFLIRQGALRQHAFTSAVTCFVSDVILITASILGLQRMMLAQPQFRVWMTWLGAAFLCFYGSKTLWQAMRRSSEAVEITAPTTSRKQIIILALSFSLLNPHAIIDSLILIGGTSARFPNHIAAFLFGTLTSSLVWFSLLTLTTYYFSKMLTKNHIWRNIEFLSGILMIYLSVKLVIT